ncbi:ABC transporter substrate-binding protein [Endothiovibrio diazotrophicus]
MRSDRPLPALALIALLWGAGAGAAAEGPPADCPAIVSQSPYLTHTLAWLGLSDCIVGTSRYDTLDRPRTGGVLDPDGEALALLEPALWFTSDWTPEERVQALTPPGTHAYRLDGFHSMAQVEENLRTIAAAAGLSDPAGRAAAFRGAWRAKAAAVAAGGKRALLLSACTGRPYSFGRDTWLYDLFTSAGFSVVETAERLHWSEPGEGLERLIGELNPQVIFLFERPGAKQCALPPIQGATRIVPLDGERFLHPAPILLQGLDQLIAKRAEWAGE